MAKEVGTSESKETAQEKTSGQSFLSKKMIMIAVPVFLVQVVILYFVFSKFMGNSSSHVNTKDATHKEEKSSAEGGEETARNIFIIKDVIINPAGTNGTRFLLTTIGVEVSTPEAQKELESMDVQLRDAMNTILTSKGLTELSDIHTREKLREEIGEKITSLLKNGKAKNVYFSKFIIQ